MKKNNFKNKKPQNPHRINNEIRVPKVNLVGDHVKEPGVYFIQKALEMADALDLDLVEVARNQDPPICKFMNYKKGKMILILFLS